MSEIEEIQHEEADSNNENAEQQSLTENKVLEMMDQSTHQLQQQHEQLSQQKSNFSGEKEAHQQKQAYNKKYYSEQVEKLENELKMLFKKIGHKFDEKLDINELKLVEREQHQLKNYIVDLQDKVNLTTDHLRVYLDKRYQLMTTLLMASYKKLLEIVRRSRKLELRIKNDRDIQHCLSQLEMFTEMANFLKIEIENLQEKINIEEDKIKELDEVVNEKKFFLNEKNNENLALSGQIVMKKKTLLKLELANTSKKFSSIQSCKNIYKRHVKLDNPIFIIESMCGSTKKVRQDNNSNQQLIPPINFKQTSSTLNQAKITNPNFNVLSNKTSSAFQLYTSTKHKFFYSSHNKLRSNQYQQQDEYNLFRAQQQQQEPGMVDDDYQFVECPSRHPKNIQLYPEEQTQDIQRSKTTGTRNEELEQVLLQLHQQRKENQMLHKQLLGARDKLSLMNDIFQPGVQCVLSDLERSQKKVVSSNGLQGSLYFKIHKTKTILNNNNSNIQYKDYKVQSSMMRRQIQQLVHITLKQMIMKKNQKNKGDNNEIELITYDQFKEFDSQQIIGILYMKPDYIQEFRNKFQNKIKNQITFLDTCKEYSFDGNKF